ncbi:MAG: HlyC/CorC family transporter [Alphaproteobacteria bacterium]|nr:HlyC/CorC family transporter [Alphaproteobacteria bacterium]
MIPIIIAIIVLLFLSGFFSGSETALTAASQALMHEKEKENDPRAATVNKLFSKREKLIGSILLGNNLVNILASSLATSMFITMAGEAGVAYATISMTLLVLVFAEILPKTYAIRHPNRTALAVAPIMQVLVITLSPIIIFLQWIVDKTLNLFGVTSKKETNDDETAKTELRGAINLQHDKEGKQERAMLKSVLDLADVEVSDIMTHRRNMVMVNADKPVKEIIEDVLSSHYTRLPVWREKRENIIGVLHSRALFNAVQIHKDDLENLDITQHVSKPWFILETTRLLDQLQSFRNRREHFTIVVDEYGAVQGVVTLEDVLEEIVGEIDDEHDETVLEVKKQRDGSFLAKGNTTIRDLNRQFEWNIPDENAATIAGFLLHETERIPEEGHVYSFNGFRFTIEKRCRNQIMDIKITPPSSSWNKSYDNRK